MKRYVFGAAIGMLLFAMNAQAREYAAGQLWSYRSRPGDEQSLVLINLVESAPDKSAIYHVSVLKVHIPGFKRSPHESYEAGYKIWRNAFDDGRAGIFTISIAEIIAIIEAQIPPKPN